MVDSDMRLFHFSDDPGITRFSPKSVRTPAERPEGMEWLNGPLVWAIDEWHEPMYLFPRECPRILLWATPETTAQDRLQWLGESEHRMIAYIETDWLEQVKHGVIHRYELPASQFENLDDAGMWVSRSAVEPLSVDKLTSLPEELRTRNVELRAIDRLSPLKPVWRSSLHASGIRLRNAQDWDSPAWTHSKKGRPVAL
jgi:hypothetical protein